MKLREMLKARIEEAKVTDTKLYYKGSIGIDKLLLKESGIISGEKVHVENTGNGRIFETYVLEEKEGSGDIVLYGPAARCGSIGDKVSIISFALVEDQDIKKHKSGIVRAKQEGS